MSDYQRVSLDDNPEYSQAARILEWVASEKAKVAEKLKSLDQMESDARSVVEEALGGPDGPQSEAFFEGRPIVRWAKFPTHKFNQKAFKAEHRELFDRYYEKTIGRKFTIVTAAGGEDE